MAENVNNLYRAVSGTEIHAVFGNVRFGEIQMIKYTSSRQRAPIYTLGSPNPRGMARGVRSINGALIFSHLSTKGIVEQLSEGTTVFLGNDELANYVSDKTRRGKEYTAEETKAYQASQQARQQGGTLAQTGFVGDRTTFDAFSQGTSLFKASSFGKAVAPYLADQLPPFDITLIGIPETAGADAEKEGFSPQSLIIRGVEFTTESSGTSIQDMVIEKQMAFIARSIHEWSSPITMT